MGGVEVRNVLRSPPPHNLAIVHNFPKFFRNCFAFWGCFSSFHSQLLVGTWNDFSCGTVSHRQHTLDDNIRRLRFRLQFHGDIESCAPL